MWGRETSRYWEKWENLSGQGPPPALAPQGGCGFGARPLSFSVRFLWRVLPKSQFARLQIGDGDGTHLTDSGRRAQSGASVAAVRIITIATVSGCRENSEFGLWTSPPTPSCRVPLCLRLGFDFEYSGHRRFGDQGGGGAVVRSMQSSWPPTQVKGRSVLLGKLRLHICH